MRSAEDPLSFQSLGSSVSDCWSSYNPLECSLTVDFTFVILRGIVGSADCPYFAKAEVLGDSLTYNLPNFKLHKIVIQPNEWDVS